jgi:HlyD family secretion protein
MKRLLFPMVAIVAALWAAFAMARTQPTRTRTDPPAPPPVSEVADRVAAVGLVEPSSESVSIGTPLPGIVWNVFVVAGQHVKRGEPLFELDTRHLRATLGIRQEAVHVARARAQVAETRLVDAERLWQFAEQVSDRRAVSAEDLAHRRSAVDTARAELDRSKAETRSAEAEVHAVRVEIDRSIVRAPLAAEVLQVTVRPGEFAPAAQSAAPLIVLGRATPMHVRVDVDEHEAWRVRPGARAVGHVRGNAALTVNLAFVRFEPFVMPKRSLTGDSTERVDTRVLQVIYRVEQSDAPLFVGQQLDVFIEDPKVGGGTR